MRAFEQRGVAALPARMRTRLARFSSGLESDQGGASELTTVRRGYVRRLTELEGSIDLLAADLQQRGLMTARGRVRSTYTLLLQTIDRWDRIAQRLGLERRSHRVPTLDEVLDGEE